MTEYVVVAELTAWESKSIIWFCSKQSSVFFFFFPPSSGFQYISTVIRFRVK